MRASRSLGHQILVWSAIVAGLVWTIFPFLWAFLYSIKPAKLDYGAALLPFVQFRPTLDHWRWEWLQRGDSEGLGRAMLTSAVVAGAVAVLAIGLGLLGAAGLIRIRRARLPLGPIVALLLLPRAIPSVTIAAPLSMVARRIGLIDTKIALIAIHTTLALPLALLVLHAGLTELPVDLFDAARLDGATNLQVLRQIALPLLRPMLVAVGFLCFALSWNEYLLALYNFGHRTITAPVAMALVEDRDGIQFDHLGTHVVLVTLPPLVLAFATQRFIVRGLSLGAVQG